MRLTAKERVLLYLLEVSPSTETVEVSPDRTQQGVARGSWIDLRHVPQYVRPLVREGLVREHQAHVKGIRQRRKVYDLTDSGRLAAVRLREAVKAEKVQVRDASGVHESTVSEIMREAGGSRYLLEIARQSIETGTVDLSTAGHLSGTAAEVVRPDAVRCEREYDWLGAAEVYKNALGSSDKVSQHGWLYERLGYALHRAALQADRPDEFRARMEKALHAYGRANEAYRESGDTGTSGGVLRCYATTAYVKFWLADTIDARRKELDEAWDYTKASLKAFEEAGDERGYGTTKNQLALVPALRFYMVWDARTHEQALREAVEDGERAIEALSHLGEPRELARAYASTAADLNLLGFAFGGPEGREACSRKAFGYWQKATELSEEAAMLELFLRPSFWGDGTDESLAVCRRSLEYARRSNDRFLLGWALGLQAYHRYWKSLAAEDLTEWKELLTRGLEDAESSGQQFECIGFTYIGGGAYSAATARAEYYGNLSHREIDLRVRDELLRKGVAAGRTSVMRALELGYPEPLGTAQAACAKLLISLAQMETDPGVKKRLFAEALGYVEESNVIELQRHPSFFYNLGSGMIQRACTKSDLADLTETRDAKRKVLQEAVQDAEIGVDLELQDMAFYERKGEVAGFAEIGVDESRCADMYTRLFELTGEKAHLLKAAGMFERAAESFRRPGLPSRVAECHWKAGKALDSLEEHMRAAEEFALACRTYKTASEVVPQLGVIYQDLALYLQAWSEIEKARHHHAKEEYGEAREYYERAATLHGLSRKWSFMSPNYAAWAQLEGAEGLSRAEEGAEAVAAFERAGALFREARGSLKGALGNLQDLDEQRMVEALVDAAERRRQYTAARIALEEARILDKNGEQASSSRRYGQAADGFEKLAADANLDRDRKDLSLIATLAKAWEAMAKAEAEASPELYAEAARFFDAARELSPSEKAKALALGHSRFCHALEAGTRFADNRDAGSYTSAIKHLDSAAGYYARANAVTASEYARASKFLFDAYAAMDWAAQEPDQEKKARAYLAVERILETCAAAFGSADQPGKREQALRLLEGVKRERELAVSLMEIFRAPLAASSTAAFATPAPSYEEAVGIGRLEHADIRATLIAAAKSLSVGEEVKLKLELVNAGRATGQLIKVDELIPVDFELVSGPEAFAMEEHSLNLKGKQLEPLKTEQVQVVLRPKAKGVFTLRPRIMYLDESGNYKSHASEPIEVNVVG